MQVHEIMTKTSECVGPNDAVAIAEKLMALSNLTSIAVCDHMRVVGTISMSDIKNKFPFLARSSQLVKVSESMHHHTTIAHEFEDVVIARARMAAEGLSSLPVLDELDRIVGLIRR